MYKLPNCHLSELALDVDSASPEVQLHHGDTCTRKSRHKDMKVKKPRANQSCHRRPTPDAFAVEHYRHEGDSGPEDDGSPDDLRRRRSRSSTSRQRDGKKTVQWADELEQESPEQMSEPATATLRTKSAMKRGPANQQEKEEEKPEDMTEGLAKLKIAEDDTAQEVQACTLRRDRRSSISRPKRTMARSDTTKPTVCSSAALDRPPSPLIPSARDFSFDNQPEVLTVDSRSAHQSRPANATWTKDNPPLPRSTSSYFQAKPKRNGSIRPPPAKVERKPACEEDSRTIDTASSAAPLQDNNTNNLKTAAALPKSSSSSMQSFSTVKNFWTEKVASETWRPGDGNASIPSQLLCRNLFLPLPSLSLLPLHVGNAPL